MFSFVISKLIARTKRLERFFYKFICFTINHYFFVILWMIVCSSSLSLEEIKLIAIANWIFHVLDLLRLFMMSMRYSLMDGVSFVFTTTFIFDMIVLPKITYPYLFLIFFWLNNFHNVSIYSDLVSLNIFLLFSQFLSTFLF